MCGGYQILVDADNLQAAHGGAQWRPGHSERHIPRSSVRPTTFAPVLVRGQSAAQDIDGTSSGPSVEIAMMKWGLVPSWTQPNSAGKVAALINARRETVQELPSFAGALKARVSRRCVVVSTGFFEWEKGLTKTARKTPYLINLGDPEETKEMLFMAGVYDVWNPPGSDQPLYSFAICTTSASEQFSWLHHRLPCILATQKDVDDWLDVEGIPGEEAADKVLKTLHSGLVWRQMSQDLQRPVSTPRSQNVKLDVKKYFAPRKSEEPKSSSFPRSFAERVGYSELPPLQKLGPLESPIKKHSKRNSSNALPSQSLKAGKSQGAKAPSKKPEKPGQRKITSFFRKVE